jgi:hypothetical protein
VDRHGVVPGKNLFFGVEREDSATYSKTRKRILRPALLDVKFKLFMEGITTDGDARPPSSSLARETRPVLLHRISQYDRLRDILHWLAPLLALAL